VRFKGPPLPTSIAASKFFNTASFPKGLGFAPSTWAGFGAGPAAYTVMRQPLSLPQIIQHPPKPPNEAQAEKGRCPLDRCPCGCLPEGRREVAVGSAGDLAAILVSQQPLSPGFLKCPRRFPGNFSDFCSPPTEASVGRQWAVFPPGWGLSLLPACREWGRGSAGGPGQDVSLCSCRASPATGSGGFFGPGAVLEGSG